MCEPRTGRHRRLRSTLLKGGNIPVAYVYPKGLRETRDLLRRCMYFVHQRAALITHVQIVNGQYNLPEFTTKLIYARNRAELKIAERCDNPQLRKSIEVDLAVARAFLRPRAGVPLAGDDFCPRAPDVRCVESGDG